MDWRQKRDVSARDTKWFNMVDRDGDGTISAEELGMNILHSSQLTPRQARLVQGMGIIVTILIFMPRNTVDIG